MCTSALPPSVGTLHATTPIEASVVRAHTSVRVGALARGQELAGAVIGLMFSSAAAVG